MKLSELRINAHSSLNPQLLSDIAALNALMPEYELYYEPHSLNSEKAFYTAFGASSALIGFLSFLWIPQETEAEITALIHPNLRGMGIFSKMLENALKECSRLGIKQLYYSLPDGCNKIKPHQYSHSEYLMKLNNCSEVYNKNALTGMLEKLNIVYKGCNGRTGTCLLADRFSQKTLCSCSLADEETFTNICSVETDISFRRKGLATLLIRCVAANVPNPGKPFILQVSGRNTQAFGLYEKCGFETVSRVDYYSVIMPSHNCEAGP